MPPPPPPPPCELCPSPASAFCPSDSAFLCLRCDSFVHSANFLVARHSRVFLCRRCSSLTNFCCTGSSLALQEPIACNRCASSSDAAADESSDRCSGYSVVTDCESDASSAKEYGCDARRDRRMPSKMQGSLPQLSFLSGNSPGKTLCLFPGPGHIPDNQESDSASGIYDSEDEGEDCGYSSASQER